MSFTIKVGEKYLVDGEDELLCVFISPEDEVEKYLFVYEDGGVWYSVWVAIDQIQPIQEVTFEKDEKVMVSENQFDWSPRYFSHKYGDEFCCFNNGATSWTQNDTTSWKFCRKPTKEEFGE